MMTSTEIQHDLDTLQSQLAGAKDARKKLQTLLEASKENVALAESALAQICTDRTLLVRRAIMSGTLESIDDRDTIEKSRMAADLLAHRRDMVVDITREIAAVDSDTADLRKSIEHHRSMLGRAIFDESIAEIRPMIPLMQKSLRGWCAFADRSDADHLARGYWLTEIFNHESTSETPTAS